MGAMAFAHLHNGFFSFKQHKTYLFSFPLRRVIFQTTLVEYHCISVDAQLAEACLIHFNTTKASVDESDT